MKRVKRKETYKNRTNFFMIWISLLHLSLFLGVSSRRHIFTASFSFVSFKTDNSNSIIVPAACKHTKKCQFVCSSGGAAPQICSKNITINAVLY